jgi:glycosyltransferase involved in cell wall biosynthesis
MVKITYLSLKTPHIGHLVWLKAFKALGYDVNVVSIYSLSSVLLDRGDILVTEGVRPTISGILRGGLYKCWASVAASPSILNPLINKLYTLTDLVIAVSSLVKGLVKNRAVVLYPVPPELEALLSIEVVHDVKKPWICFSGALIPIKGFHLIPEIAYELRKENIRASIILIGDTRGKPLEQLIVNKARRLEVEDYIKIVGILPRIKVFKLLSSCSIYLQPSLFDAFPISVAEAMALGAVPVVTKYVGSRDLVTLVDRLLIREIDPKDIARALIFLLTDPRVLKEYSQLSKVAVREVLSYKSTLDRVRDFVEVCLNAGNE